MSLLEIRNLQVTFGGLDALSNLDFSIEEGEIVSVIGPNGAGKTTFFNTISGMIPPTSGEIIFNGESVLGLDPNQITEMGIARTFQNVRLFPNMTVLENVMVSQHCRTSQLVIGALFQTKAFKQEEKEIRERSEEILGFFGTRLIGYRLDQPAFALSYANRRRLEIARAMATQLRDEWGFTIVIIEHDMKVVRDVSDRVVVLDHGVPIAQGAYDEVSTNPDVIEAYLGRPVEAKS